MNPKRAIAEQLCTARRYAAVVCVATLYALLLAALPAHAAGCYQWGYGGSWGNDPATGATITTAWCNAHPGTNPEVDSCTGSCVPGSLVETGYTTVQAGGWPNVRAEGTCVFYLNQESTTWSVSEDINNLNCGVYVSALPQPSAQCGMTCNGVGEPINPASGGLYSEERDLGNVAGTSGLERFYNSIGGGSADNPATNWRYGFSRSVQPRYASTGYTGPYVTAPYNSQLYTTESTACTFGFLDIQGQVTTWAHATASYSNGVCRLSIGATSIGTLPILYSARPSPDPSALVLVGADATRDDGRVVSFVLNGSALVAPPGISLRLQQTSSGFTLTDNDDAMEAYDSTGKLSTVTTRTGVLQTLSYDTSGRLAAVVDSFGHGLTLSYNVQGQLVQVSKQ